MPFNIDAVTIAPQKGRVFNLVPSVQGVAENSIDMIRVEVCAGDSSFTLRHAVLVDGPFQLPEGYQLASDIVYLYSDPSQPVRPFILHLPHWYSQEEEEEEGQGDDVGLTFVKAPHIPSQSGEVPCYTFELVEGGDFPLLTAGSLLVKSHSALFGIAYKERPQMSSKLKYYVTHLEREDDSGLKVDIAVTFASTSWIKVCL